MKASVVISLSCLLPAVASVLLNSLACSEEFCENYRETIGCAPLDIACRVQNTTHNGLIFPSATPCACCEVCLTNLKEGDYCSKGDPGSPLPNSICGDGLYCQVKKGNEYPTCEPMFETSECFQHKRKHDDDLRSGLIGHLQESPHCDGDGDFGPLICVPGQNCFCVNERGERIFGDGLHQENIHHMMQCGCSRMNDKLNELVEQRFPFFTTRCKADGSFDPLQCFGDLCVCVDERTGSPTSDAKFLTKLVGLSELPCYDEKIHHDGFNYDRPCENIKQGLINTVFEAKRSGVLLDELDDVLDICDPDGYYSPVQSNDLSVYCADKNGERIEEYSLPKGSKGAETMNCKCARAKKLLLDNNYMEIPQCCSNGNYKKVACRRGFCYCVDADGKQVSVEVLDIHRNKLPCHKSECN